MAIERIVPGTKEWESYYSNHIVRYKFAVEHITNPKRILDAACGVGYGTKYLVDFLNVPVIGVDINDEALEVASAKFKSQNTIFLKNDCERLDLVEGKFSHVVSFETFEHLKKPVDFLRRVSEILEKGGNLILSTPNASVTSPDRKVDWKYHETEYTASELVEMVRQSGFKNIQLYGEKYTSIGLLRNEFRKELHRLHHNPFVRFGKWIQNIVRGLKTNYAVLPEREDDFYFKFYDNPKSCEMEGLDGPFVLMIVCEK